MSVKRMLYALAALAFSLRANAESSCKAGEAGCEESGPTPNADAEEAPAQPRLINASGLIPLRELNSRPYAGLWFYDFRFHALELGISLTSLGVSGEIVSSGGSNGTPITVAVGDAAALYLGAAGSYYLPLIGYSPSVSLGLLPELCLQFGGFGSGSSSNYTDELAETKIGSALELPVFVLLRLGKHASRYSDWKISLGGGIGMTLVSFNTGQPVRDSGTYLAPALRVELGYGGLKVGFESALAAHDNFDSNSAPVRLAYRAQTLTFTFMTQPDPED